MKMSDDDRRLALQLQSLRMSRVREAYAYEQLTDAFNLVESVMPDDVADDLPSSAATLIVGSIMSMIEDPSLSRKAIAEVLYHNVLGNL